MPLEIWLAVGVLGGTLSITRFLTDAVISMRARSDFPWGTFTINITGSFALGILTGAGLAGNALLLAGTASIGSFTTFSTWMFEAHRLGDDDERRPLVAYIVMSLAVGLGAAALGRTLGRAL